MAATSQHDVTTARPDPRFALRVRGQGQRVRSLLAIYLQDHHAAGVAGARVAKRAALAIDHRAGNDGDLTRVASEISQDLIALEGIMRQLGVEPDRVKDTFSRIAERVSRSKLNGRLLRRSPLSDLLELETLVVGITGKQALWVTLREVLPAQVERFDQLLKRAEEQKRLVENARLEAARRGLRAAHTP
jgi:hypothetical protein